MRPTLSGPDCAVAPSVTEAAASAASADRTKRFEDMLSLSVNLLFENEAARLAQEEPGLVAMRRVSAIGDLKQAGFRQSPGNGADLRHRPVLVVRALHGEHRARDRLDLALDVPVTEFGREPGVVPASEGRVGVGVVAGQAGAQVALLEGVTRLVDAGDRDVLDEEVRRDGDDAGYRVARRVQQRDRAAVAVPEEPRRGDADRGEEGRQDLVGLAVHEVGGPALVAWLGRRAAIAVAREDEAG